MKINHLSLCALLLFLGACSTGQKEFTKYTLELPEILNQVNNDIQVARALNKFEKPPVIKSVQLNLEVGVTTNINGGLPIGLVTTKAEIDKQNIHRISLTFTPKPVDLPATIDTSKVSELAATISNVDRAVATANPGYHFEDGEVEIQCSLEESGGASIGDSGDDSGGSGGGDGGGKSGKSLKLVPAKLGVSRSNQLVQTIILNFGSSDEAAKPTGD